MQTSTAFAPGEININLQSKIRDANKHDKHSSKLVPKSPHTAQDPILKQTLN